jgi:ABC-type nitrate/sulfonate/bicarbonate transport systems, periplasmic components
VIVPHRPLRPLAVACLFVCALLLADYAASARADLRAVTLQLKWRPQFQFAGYYMADRLGYYRRQGLVVRIKAGGAQTKPSEEVAAGRAEFGVSGVDILSLASNGKSLVSLAAIYQHSPAAILVRDDSHIRSPGQLIGHKVARIKGSSNDVEFLAVLKEEGVDPAKVQWVNLDFDLERLLQGDIEAQSVNITNEPFILEKRKIAYHLIQPINYGVDFYGDCLFTTAQRIVQDPDLVEGFRKASLDGWRYAITHPTEAVDRMIAARDLGLSESDRARLLFEARESSPLIDSDFAEIGRQNPDRWGRIQEYLRKQGMIRRAVDPEEFVYRPGGALTTRQLNERVDRARFLMGVLVVFLAVYLIHNWSLRRGIRQKTFMLADAQKNLEARGRALQSLVELGHTLAGVRDSEAISASIVDQIRKGTGFDRVGIYLVDEDLRVLRGVAGVNDRGETEDAAATST